MDERVKELLDRVRDAALTAGQVAGVTARCAGKYAGQMVDVAKLNMKIFDLRAETAGLLRDIGQVVYDAHLGRDAAGDDQIGPLLEQIDERNEAIRACKEQVAVLKKCKRCPACGAVCGRDDKFCKDCGAAF